jgi:hypothetical protein
MRLLLLTLLPKRRASELLPTKGVAKGHNQVTIRFFRLLSRRPTRASAGSIIFFYNVAATGQGTSQSLGVVFKHAGNRIRKSGQLVLRSRQCVEILENQILKLVRVD